MKKLNYFPGKCHCKKSKIMEIYRHKFSATITEKIAQFSATHGESSLSEFRKQWSVFMVANMDIIEPEVKRLESEGVIDVMDRFFNSARYWHTKKKTTSKTSVVEERTYIVVNKSFLETIDAHVTKSGISKKPSNAFDDFCQEHKDALAKEVNSLNALGLSIDEIRIKVKKTYKNRHFLKRTTEIQ